VTRAVRIALIAALPVIGLPLAIIAGCPTAGDCGDPWDAPAGSVRNRLYSALVEHRYLVVALCVAYGVTAAAVFRQDIVDACSRRAVLRVLGLITIAIIAAAGGVLLSMI
jgi:hypothetical protein